jgi:hypothetical protein
MKIKNPVENLRSLIDFFEEHCEEDQQLVQISQNFLEFRYVIENGKYTLNRKSWIVLECNETTAPIDVVLYLPDWELRFKFDTKIEDILKELKKVYNVS